MAIPFNYPSKKQLKQPSKGKQPGRLPSQSLHWYRQPGKRKETEFATVIVFLREGHGGFMFIHNEKTTVQVQY